MPDERAPSILEEVQAVASMLPQSQLHVGVSDHGGAARARRDSRIVHIATHGFFREDNPLFSGVRLGDSYLTWTTSTAAAAGRSHLGERMRHRTPGVAAGDELRGLVRGLFSAGARSLLVTFWNVHDRSTALFVASFYVIWGPAATRRRPCNWRWPTYEEYPHPYYWAPFILVGADWAPPDDFFLRTPIFFGPSHALMP